MRTFPDVAKLLIPLLTLEPNGRTFPLRHTDRRAHPAT